MTEKVEYLFLKLLISDCRMLIEKLLPFNQQSEFSIFSVAIVSHMDGYFRALVGESRSAILVLELGDIGSRQVHCFVLFGLLLLFTSSSGAVGAIVPLGL